MSMVYGERLIEFAIRVGVDDLIKDPTIANLMFFTDKHLGEGTPLTPAAGDPTAPTSEKLIMDAFQERIAALPKTKEETGLSSDGIFHNSIQAVPDIQEYFRTANIAIKHGFPREAQDLPCLAITLGNEEESQYLGTQKGTLLKDNGDRYAVTGSDWETQYQISIITPNYDETVVWYYVLKYCLTAYRPHIEAYGLRQQKLSFMDVEPAAEYLQAGLFIYQRTCILSCVKDEDVPVKITGFNGLAFGVGDPAYPQGDGTIKPDPVGP